MAEPDIFAVADRFKRALVDREEAATREIMAYYDEVERRIRERLDVIIEEMQQWRDEHHEEQMPAWWLFERQRLQALQEQVEDELARFAGRATDRIRSEQRRLVEQASQDAEALGRISLEEESAGVTVTWSRLPRETLEQLVGHLQDGSPLRTLLDELGPAASRRIRQELVGGLALGMNPRDVARRCLDALRANRVRAETIARTEMLRAYREATRQNYLANQDVLSGWVWHSAADRRTCPMCWAMRGTVHTLEERLDDHPRGRCAMIPLAKSWKQFGFAELEEAQPSIEQGEALFAQLSEEDQRAILGTEAFYAYKSGAVNLADFVGQTSDPRWGTMRYTRSLQDAIKAAEVRRLQEILTAIKVQRARKGVAAQKRPETAPQGGKFSSMFDLDQFPKRSSKTGAAVRHAMEVADKVHGTPGVKNPLPLLRAASTSTMGSYLHSRDGKPVGIEVSQRGKYPGLTFLHEAGHFIDHQLLSTPGKYASETSPMLDEWRQAVNDSDAVKKLRKELSSTNERCVQDWLEYTLREREIFARSYSQYIADRSRDEQLAEDLEEAKRLTESYPGCFWDDVDFAPIAREFDKLFTKLGWMK